MATDISFYGVMPCPLGTAQRSAGDGEAPASDNPRCDPDRRTLANTRGSRILFGGVTPSGWGNGITSKRNNTPEAMPRCTSRLLARSVSDDRASADGRYVGS